MPAHVLAILKIGLLLLIYLFFFRVLRAVWAEVAAIRAGESTPVRGPTARTDRPAAEPAPRSVAAPGATVPTVVTVTAPADLAGRRFEFQPAVTIGRDPTSTLAVSDGFVSHHHARIYTTADGPLIEDMNSTNGTFVNDVRISAAARLSVGDRIRCGTVILEAT